jgi:hypothetical protein
MRVPQPNSRKVKLLSLCGLTLSLAVVLWGAGYKMEQYPQQGCAFRMMAPAKLLTEKERPVSARNSRVVLDSARHLRPLPAWIACPRCTVLPTSAPERAMPGFPLRGFVDPEITYFSFRPPPPRFNS